jgi:hypothetical protein
VIEAEAQVRMTKARYGFVIGRVNLPAQIIR